MLRSANQTVFLSDVHLDFARPDITAQFLGYLDTLPGCTERLFIVGDLFEAWIGDDAPGPLGQQVIQQLARLSEAGVNGYFTHGNRDFLVGQKFSDDTGFTLLGEEEVIDCYGTPVLLMHGDSLCIDDEDYQALRQIIRAPEWQKQILSKSVEERLALAKKMRETSAMEMSQKSDDIMDVNQIEVQHALARHQVSTLLHGHTHRPQIHQFMHDNHPFKRIVLGDWFEQGSVVRWTDGGFELQQLPR